jgi:hypothetical protein
MKINFLIKVVQYIYHINLMNLIEYIILLLISKLKLKKQKKWTLTTYPSIWDLITLLS